MTLQQALDEFRYGKEYVENKIHKESIMESCEDGKLVTSKRIKALTDKVTNLSESEKASFKKILKNVDLVESRDGTVPEAFAESISLAISNEYKNILSEAEKKSNGHTFEEKQLLGEALAAAKMFANSVYKNVKFDKASTLMEGIVSDEINFINKVL